MGETKSIAGVTRAESKVPDFKRKHQGCQVTSNSPAALSLSTVNQCPRSIGEFAMAACRHPGLAGPGESQGDPFTSRASCG